VQESRDRAGEVAGDEVEAAEQLEAAQMLREIGGLWRQMAC